MLKMMITFSSVYFFNGKLRNCDLHCCSNIMMTFKVGACTCAPLTQNCGDAVCSFHHLTRAQPRFLPALRYVCTLAFLLGVLLFYPEAGGGRVPRNTNNILSTRLHSVIGGPRCVRRGECETRDSVCVFSCLTRATRPTHLAYRPYVYKHVTLYKTGEYPVCVAFHKNSQRCTIVLLFNC